MAGGPRSTALRQIQRVFALGTISAMEEEDLLGHFLSRRDEAAFEAIVARHGPMIWAVCRRLLPDPVDAEDAFQATFLILLRKAGSLRDPGGLGPWLYGVACRVALRARSDAARRRDSEAHAARSEAVEVEPVLEPDRMTLALHEEIRRLPDKYRRPVVLCCLEGLTYEEAARRLRWTSGMVKGRLTRARERLRAGLTRRGLRPEAGALGAALVAERAPAAVPGGLAELNLGMLTRSAAGGSSAVSARSLTLAEGTLRSMLVGKLKLTSMAALALVATYLMAWASVRGERDPKDSAQVKDRAAPSREERPEQGPRQPERVRDAQPGDPASDRAVEPSGLVVLPDGRPADGAAVALATPGNPVSIRNGTMDGSTRAPWVMTGKDGGFRISSPAGAYVLVALHDKGYADAHSDEFARSRRLVLKPWGRLRGQVLIQRRPAGGASISVSAMRPGSKDGIVLFGESTARTDEQGRFALHEVIPGPSVAMRYLVTEYSNGSASLKPCWPEPVDVRPGETTEVQIGGKGRTVVGQAVVEPSAPMPADWTQNEPVLLWRWLGRDVLASYGANLDRAGRFRIDDVTPGRYELEIAKNGPSRGDQTGPGPKIGNAHRTIVVPEIQGGRIDEPFDLGAIEVRLNGGPEGATPGR